MNTVKVRNIEIGAGKPKIILPIVGRTSQEILSQAKALESIPHDAVEWRVDWFDSFEDSKALMEVLKELRKILKDTPLLFTFRTKKEGGEKDLDPGDYQRLNIEAIESGQIDLVDAELFALQKTVEDIIQAAHEHGVKVIASSHDFQKTPDKEEIIARLCQMQILGADLLKIAVMPQSARDVLRLLDATEEMVRVHASQPVITMSMAGQGAISRICGEIFGSAMTFGSAGKASAPGQIDAENLSVILDTLHRAL